MLKLYVAIIAAYYNTLNGVSLGAHKFVTTVQKEAECVLCSTKILVLDMFLLQESLKACPHNAELKCVSVKDHLNKNSKLGLHDLLAI